MCDGEGEQLLLLLCEGEKPSQQKKQRERKMRPKRRNWYEDSLEEENIQSIRVTRFWQSEAYKIVIDGFSSLLIREGEEVSLRPSSKAFSRDESLVILSKLVHTNNKYDTTLLVSPVQEDLVIANKHTLNFKHYKKHTREV